MTIVARYADSDIEIEGSGDALRELASELQRLHGDLTLTLFVPARPASPYDGYAKALTLVPRGDYVRVSQTGDEIFISGARDKLDILAKNIGRLAEGEDAPPLSGGKRHLHIEYYPGHFYVESGSIPLVVTRS
jgi:hypothetical protein